jgi:hypothetical protein
VATGLATQTATSTGDGASQLLAGAATDATQVVPSSAAGAGTGAVDVLTGAASTVVPDAAAVGPALAASSSGIGGVSDAAGTPLDPPGLADGLASGMPAVAVGPDPGTAAAPSHVPEATTAHLPVPAHAPEGTGLHLPAAHLLVRALEAEGLALAHAAATPEFRLVVAGLITSAAAGAAAGVGPVDFTAPMLRSCGDGIRAAFGAVRLSACPGQAAARSVAVPHPRAAVRSAPARAGGDPPAVTRVLRRPLVLPRLRTGLLPAAPNWRVPAADTFLLRMIAAGLAAMSGLVAGGTGISRYRSRRATDVYRRRLHS